MPHTGDTARVLSDEVGAYDGVLCVEPALGVEEARGVHSVALLEAVDLLADRRHHAGPLGAEYVGKRRLGPEHCGVPAFTLEGIP